MSAFSDILEQHFRFTKKRVAAKNRITSRGDLITAFLGFHAGEISMEQLCEYIDTNLQLSMASGAEYALANPKEAEKWLAELRTKLEPAPRPASGKEGAG
jgi:hypothetical protein